MCVAGCWVPCGRRPTLSVDPRPQHRAQSLRTLTPTAHSHQTSGSFSVTQDSWDCTSLKCFSFWQTDQYFKNQSIPGIHGKPLIWPTGVLGEKPWFQRSPPFQSSD